MNNPNIVILAGGVSSRMKKKYPQASTIDPYILQEVQRKSKTMLGVGNQSRPFLDYLLHNIQESGYLDVVIVVGEHDESIQKYYETQNGALQFSRLTISYAIQKIPYGRTKPLGTADALFEALKTKPSWRNKSFTVCNSDNLYSLLALKSLLENDHKNALIDYDRSALQFDHNRIQAFSVIKKDKDGFLVDIIEKPSPEEIKEAKDASGRIGVSMNIFKLSFDMIYPFLETIPLHHVRQEKELPIAVKMMIERYPRCLKTIPLSEHVIDLTTQSDIPQVQDYLRKEYPDFLTGSR